MVKWILCRSDIFTINKVVGLVCNYRVRCFILVVFLDELISSRCSTFLAGDFISGSPCFSISLGVLRDI